MIRVLIVEDQKIMQKYFEYIILKNPEFKLVDTVSDAREAVKICNYSVIDLVLMDIWKQGLSDHHSPQHPRLGGPQLRPAHQLL